MALLVFDGAHPDLDRVEAVGLEPRQLVVRDVRRHVNQRLPLLGAQSTVAEPQAAVTYDVRVYWAVGVERWIPRNVQ